MRVCPVCPTPAPPGGEPLNPHGYWLNPTCPTFPAKKQGVQGKTGRGKAAPPPKKHWLDPVEDGFLPTYSMARRDECKGYPGSCQRCRLLMADLKTCLLEPEGGSHDGGV